MPPADDELDPLPPRDGDDGDASGAEPAADETDLDETAGDASLDDSTGEDAPAETEDLDLEEDSGWLDEAADSPTLDLGESGLSDLGAAPEPEDAEEPGVGEEDFGLATGPEHVDLDAGEEGPEAADEDLRDADLPALDADEEGDVEDSSLLDAAFAADEPLGVPWASTPWERVGARSGITSANAVACTGRGAIVAGRLEGGAVELLLVDLEGGTTPLAARGLDVATVRALRVGQGGALVALSESGAAFSSLDAGASFHRDETASSVPRVHDDPPAARAPVVRAALGLCAACAARGGGVLRATAEADWTAYPWNGAVSAMAFLDRGGNLVAATYQDADDTTALVRLDGAGHASVVARIGAEREDPDSDGRVRAVAFDEARGVVWLAGGFGLAAFAVR